MTLLRRDEQSESKSHSVDPEIRAYYERAPEEHRLESGAAQLEAARTRELIERHAPAPPAIVIDVGGGAGAYSAPLAAAGYTVHLLDASARLVAEARRRSATLSHPIASCEVGDARALPFGDDSSDVVLLLGPLYHLVAATDRARALTESARALRSGGMLFAAAISRWASALDGLSRDLFADDRFVEICERDLRTGVHRNATERVDYFTTAYLHRPDELRAEVAAAGLVVEGVHGVEGPGWLFPDFDDRWADPRRRADLLRIARAFDAEPSVVGVSAHLLAVARKP